MMTTPESFLFTCSSRLTSNIDSSTDFEPPVSEVSDQYSMLDHAQRTVRNAIHTTADGKVIGEDSSLNLPTDGLIVGHLMEIMATHLDASLCCKRIGSFAKTLTVRVATYLTDGSY